jgi:16S rRNA (cytosine1402-N4)-methyltransferase
MSADRVPVHESVLPVEVLALLDPKPGEEWVDCTVGGGGHTRLIADRVAPTGRVIGLDQDPTMLALARGQLTRPHHEPGREHGAPIELVHANFDQLAEVLAARNLKAVDGVFADLGFSSDQLVESARGLSFRDDGPLDMRLDPTAGATAADLVNRMGEAALADVFWEYGEERYSRRVARRIVERRTEKPFTTTADLAGVVRSCVPRSGAIDPATRVFQALRIAVNDELGALDRLLAALPRAVKPGGRAGVISFHSLEDRRVKHAFRATGVWRVVNKKPVEAGAEETARNPRSRSAKLRVAVRIEN